VPGCSLSEAFPELVPETYPQRKRGTENRTFRPKRAGGKGDDSTAQDSGGLAEADLDTADAGVRDIPFAEALLPIVCATRRCLNRHLDVKAASLQPAVWAALERSLLR
jgi:hypothetical protein